MNLLSALPLKVLWVFLFINAISFNFFPSFTTNRLAFLALTIFFILRYRFVFKQKEILLLFFLLSLACYSMVVSVLNIGDTTQFSRLFHFALFSILAPLMLFRMLNNEYEFHLAVVFATIAQIFFVFLTYTSRSFNDVLFSVVLANNNFGESLGRAPGLSSSGGATLSVIISLGAFSIVRLAKFGMSSWHLPVLILICFSNIIVGRTGLILSLFALMMFFTRSRVNMRSMLMFLLLAFVFWLFIADFLIQNEQFLQYTLKWALSGLSGDGTASALLAMGLPKMSISQLLLGTGSVVLPTGLNASGSDIGYVQSIFSLGLIISCLFYSLLFCFLSSYAKGCNDEKFAFFIIFLTFFIEVKEPFIFKYFYVFYVFMSLLLLKRERV
ncbi:hypothetical protein [Pseudoalteromonas sp. T1lg22]|uniref:hypothetical protein n=1 Tax=Pseudoalteromonas sp. T1lg22 TaxID=2077096 RepID=UPI000CF63BAA|nr:hypothetical protein [Pseudoalteromonas sp. T1lg22]